MRFKGTRKIVGGLALAALFALGGVAALAQTGQQGDGQRAERPWGQQGEGMGRRGGRGGDDFAGPFGRLNLTDAQREQLRQIAERYRQTFEAQRGQGGEGRGGERRRDRVDPFAGGTFDEAAVRAAAQARANAQVEREVAHARMMHEMYNVLTPEQKSQLAADRQERQQRRQSRRGGQQQQWQ